MNKPHNLTPKGNQIDSELSAALGPGLEFDRDLASLTTFGTGGPARYFLTAVSADEISAAVTTATRLNLPLFLMGGGSNLLISDRGFDGLVVRVDVRGMEVIDSCSISCGAGEDLTALVDFATEHSLTGIEFAAGIWGTVGGAIYGNAGAYGGEIGRRVEALTLVEPGGKVKKVDGAYCRFGYRDSYLKTTGEIVVEARFLLEKGDVADIRQRVQEIVAVREVKFPPESKSAGCFFKNIPDPKEKFGKLPAGRLLEQVGAKGMSVGGARVFDKHANIIVNTGGATSKDIRQLADKLKEKVFAEFGIRLEEEIIQVGDI